MRSTHTLTLVVGLSASLASHAAAQSFTNGNFETNDLSGWTVVNTANGAGAPGAVTTIDIDGPGALTASLAAVFGVGNAVSMPNNQAGIEMTQSLNLTAGTQYTFDFDWSAQRTSATNNAEGGVFSLIVDGNIVATASAGGTSSTTPHYGHINATFTPTATGPAVVGVRITRPFTVAGLLSQYVDNVTVVAGGGPTPCYANCDGSTNNPLLTANDFQCFLNEYAGGSSYANCDASTSNPLLTANDFQCFLNAYAGGCS